MDALILCYTSCISDVHGIAKISAKVGSIVLKTGMPSFQFSVTYEQDVYTLYALICFEGEPMPS